MKKYFFILAIIGSGIAAQAQPASLFFKHLSPQQRKHQQKINRLLMQQNTRLSLEKPTTTRQRVIAQTVTEGGDMDSTAFKYSGNRTSGYNYDNMEDLMYRDYFDDYYYAGDYLTGQAADMQADTISYYNDTDGDLIPDLGNQYIAHYRSNNKIDSMHYFNYYSGTIGYAEKYFRAYNTQGFLTDVYGLFATNGTTYDTAGHQKLSYSNDFSKVLSDTMWSRTGGSLMLSEATQYIYSNDKLTEIRSFSYAPNSGLFVPDENTVIRYYNDGKIRSVSVYEADELPAYGLETRDSFIYTPGVDYFTEWYEDSWFAGDYEYGIHMVQFPGANGLPDSLKAYSREDADSTFESDGSLYYTYNSYNNPIHQRIIFPDDPTDSIIVNFYYEEYDDDLGMGSLNNDNIRLAVYPNPFTGMLNIQWSGIPSDNATLSVYNTLGQLVLKTDLKLQRGRNATDLSALPAGVYIIQLNNGQGRPATAKILKN